MVVAACTVFAGCSSNRGDRGPALAARTSTLTPRTAVQERVPAVDSAVKQAVATTPMNSEASKAPAAPAAGVAEVLAKAEAFYDRTPKFTCRITRQERLGANLQPTEKILHNFRAQPRSVYYRWVGEVCAGRECVWVENANEGKIVSKGGKSDFGIAGMRVAVAPDSLLAKSRSRHPITNTGQDLMVKKLRGRFEQTQRGELPSDAIKYAGLENPREGSTPLHHIVEAIQPGTPLFADGGVRDFYFDPETGRVVLVEAKDPSGDRQEYYHFEHLFANNTLSAADFDPDVVFAKPGKGTGEPPK